MKVKINCEPIGSIATTKKGGFIRSFLTVDSVNEKAVIKIYSANQSDLEQDGVKSRIVETDDFCFAPKA